MLANIRAQQLHDKATRGLELTAQEQAELDAWYAAQDTAEQRLLGASTATASLALFDQLPESKLELIDGRLVAGNDLLGSRALLSVILRSLGPKAAFPFAPLGQWWKALAVAFEAPPSLASKRDWRTWAEALDHIPVVEQAGPSFDWQHHNAYQTLLLALYSTAEDHRLGTCIQRFVMRLRDDGFQPDIQLIRRDHLHRLQTYYTDGPADLVIEVVLPGSEAHDRELKRRLYARGGIGEYWIVEPSTRSVELLRLEGTAYIAQSLDGDNRYRPSSIPGLAFEPAMLWEVLSDRQRSRALDAPIFSVENVGLTFEPSNPSDEEEDWSGTWQPFNLPVGPHQTPIAFEDYVRWCPEAKFEWLDGKPHIGGWTGTRNVLGLLLKTFGLTESMRLLHPREWVVGLLAEEAAQANDAQQRERWWNEVQRAAELLRARFGAGQLAVIGDLLAPTPLHYWSELTVVSWERLEHEPALYRALRDLAVPIDIRELGEALPQQRAAVAHDGLLL